MITCFILVNGGWYDATLAAMEVTRWPLHDQRYDTLPQILYFTTVAYVIVAHPAVAIA